MDNKNFGKKVMLSAGMSDTDQVIAGMNNIDEVSLFVAHLNGRGWMAQMSNAMIHSTKDTIKLMESLQNTIDAAKGDLDKPYFQELNTCVDFFTEHFGHMFSRVIILRKL